MKIFYFICLVIMALAVHSETVSIFKKTFEMLHHEPPPPKAQSRQKLNFKIIKQKLDNFDETNEVQWDMRYLENGEHFKTNGPIFIFVGGEWEISEGYIKGGHFYDMAKQKNGYLFYTEHRYYGKSHPTDDLSVENLKYLTVEQALADLAYFIKEMKKKPEFKNSKVILAGGSYSATMVTWFKVNYPDLAVASWASSAPLSAKVDFEEYKEVAGNSINVVGGSNCYDRINRGIKDLENMFTENKIGEIKALLQICDEFNTENKYDVWSLFSTISDNFAGLVQSHNKGNIEKACEVILAQENDLIGVTVWFMSRLGGNGCYDFTYADSIKSLSETKWSNNIYRQWFYQTCTEFGWYQTSKASKQPFGTKFPVDLYTKICEDVYGISNETLYENIEKTNKNFGGFRPNVQNVFMTHGSLDPWNAMGIYMNEDGENNVIPLYSHCKDFPSISSADTAEMKFSKEKLQKFIFKLLDDVQ